MAVTYENFRGDVYYLHVRKTKKGNNTYYFSKKNSGNLANELPKEYEIYEEPNGKVYARKRLKKLITNEEIRLFKEGMRQYSSIRHFKLDVKEEFIYIYTISTPFENLPLIMDAPLPEKYTDYETVMRFELIDPETRLFHVQRYCFLGGIDDWIELEGSTDLEYLLKEYIPHIGQESFYDLF